MIYRIDKFLEYYNSLKDCQMEIEKGIWVNAKPLPYYYGALTLDFWKIFFRKLKECFYVLSGKAIAVTWEKID
jgi:hypothetical protein